MANADLTIVLTIKDRARFTYRWMKYMSDMHCPYKILIADGGKDVSLQEYLSHKGNYLDLDYEYLRYPYDATVNDYYIKLMDVVSRVKSEYVLLADDDDFYLLDRIPELMAFLDSHEDYVGARGGLVNFTLYGRDAKPSRLRADERYLAFAIKAASIDDSDPFERVEKACTQMSKCDYYANWYSVFRTSAFQDTWRQFVGLEIKEIIVSEILTHVLMLMSGKIKIMDFPYYARQMYTSMFGDTLVVGNEFLERCVINNSLSEFGIVIDRYFASKTREERNRILCAIAAWLEEFVSNIYLNRKFLKTGILYYLRTGKFFNFREKMKSIFLFNQKISRIYYSIRCRIFPVPNSEIVQLKVLEPYILKPGVYRKEL